MSSNVSKVIFPALAVLSLSACENMYLRPSALPGGYAYYNQQYHSPPSPEPTHIGYDYSAEKNAHILAGMKVKAEELFSQISEGMDLSGHAIYVYNARHHDAQNAAFDHVLREVVREHGFTLAKTPLQEGAYSLGYAIMEPDTLAHEINFGDLNEEYRVPFFKKYNEYETMHIEIALLDGDTTVLNVVDAAYDLPMYGYERHGQFYFLKPVLGRPISSDVKYDATNP